MVRSAMKFWIKAIVDKNDQEQLLVSADSLDELHTELEELLGITIKWMSVKDFQRDVVEKLNDSTKIISIIVRTSSNDQPPSAASSRLAGGEDNASCVSSKIQGDKPVVRRSKVDPAVPMPNSPSLSVSNGLKKMGGRPSSAEGTSNSRPVSVDKSVDCLFSTSQEMNSTMAPFARRVSAIKKPSSDEPQIQKVCLTRDQVVKFLDVRWRKQYTSVVTGCFVRIRELHGYFVYQIAEITVEGEVVLDRIYSKDKRGLDTISNTKPMKDEIRAWTKKMASCSRAYPTYGFIEAKHGDLSTALRCINSREELEDSGSPVENVFRNSSPAIGGMPATGEGATTVGLAEPEREELQTTVFEEYGVSRSRRESLIESAIPDWTVDGSVSPSAPAPVPRSDTFQMKPTIGIGTSASLLNSIELNINSGLQSLGPLRSSSVPLGDSSEPVVTQEMNEIYAPLTPPTRQSVEKDEGRVTKRSLLRCGPSQNSSKISFRLNDVISFIQVVPEENVDLTKTTPSLSPLVSPNVALKSVQGFLLPTPPADNQVSAASSTLLSPLVHPADAPVRPLIVYGTRHSNSLKSGAKRPRRSDFAGCMIRTNQKNSISRDRDVTDKGFALYCAPVQLGSVFVAVGQLRPVTDDRPFQAEGSEQVVQQFTLFWGQSMEDLYRTTETLLPLPNFCSVEEACVTQIKLIVHAGELHAFYLIRNSDKQELKSDILQESSSHNRSSFFEEGTGGMEKQQVLDRLESDNGHQDELLATETPLDNLPSRSHSTGMFSSPPMPEAATIPRVALPNEHSMVSSFEGSTLDFFNSEGVVVPSSSNGEIVSKERGISLYHPCTPQTCPQRYSLVHAVQRSTTTTEEDKISRLRDPWELLTVNEPLCTSTEMEEPLYAVASVNVKDQEAFASRASMEPVKKVSSTSSEPDGKASSTGRGVSEGASQLYLVWYSKSVTSQFATLSCPSQARSSCRTRIGMRREDNRGTTLPFQLFVSTQEQPSYPHWKEAPLCAATGVDGHKLTQGIGSISLFQLMCGSLFLSCSFSSENKIQLWTIRIVPSLLRLKEDLNEGS